MSLGRVGEPEATQDGVMMVSMLDLAGTKAAVITQRAEAKDYIAMPAKQLSSDPLSLLPRLAGL